MDEFSIINTYFNWQTNNDTLLAVGDDAAIIQSKQPLVITTDTFIEGVHFLKQTKASDIAHKALMVNLSDIAAMGAKPVWFTLALSLPNNDKQWLSDFSNSLKKLALKYQINLIGGDITRAPLSITITAIGKIMHKALCRNTAQIGDTVFISNILGDASLALHLIKQNQAINKSLHIALNQPTAQIQLGQTLANIANSCIDVSDGFIADLNHMLQQSQVGAEIDLNQMPLSSTMKAYIKKTNDWRFVLSGGDDYQLCFCVPNKNLNKIAAIKKQFKLTAIGRITKNRFLSIYHNRKKININQYQSYRHFNDTT